MSSTAADDFLRPAADWRDNAVVGGPHEDDTELAAAYLEAGEVLVEHWTRTHQESLAIPIMENLRHGVELALKAQIREVARLRRVDLRGGAIPTELTDDWVRLWLADHHALASLVDRLHELLKDLQVGAANHELPADTSKVLQRLHELDEKGQAFRYSTIRVRKDRQTMLVAARPDFQEFDLVEIASRIKDAGYMILWGVGGLLDAYHESQLDLIEEEEYYAAEDREYYEGLATGD